MMRFYDLILFRGRWRDWKWTRGSI